MRYLWLTVSVAAIVAVVAVTFASPIELFASLTFFVLAYLGGLFVDAMIQRRK